MSEDHPKHRSWLDRLTDLLSREPKNKAELMEILRDAESRDLLSAEMLSMIESVLQVSEMQVREVMVNRDGTLEDLLPLIIESGHSRFPVTDTASNDVIGTILAKDLLKYCFHKEAKQFDMTDIFRPATFVPQSKRLDILLKEFRINRNHMAIVIDEYGHVAGLVTIEDVLEQIVGDIEDEYDIDEDDFIKKHADETYTVKATTPIEDFNDYFNTEFSDEEFDTIGGLILKGFGHLPKRGEKITIENFTFKVLHSDNRRIHLLDIRKHKTANA
jgi:magnesium and cobalt transporter